MSEDESVKFNNLISTEKNNKEILENDKNDKLNQSQNQFHFFLRLTKPFNVFQRNNNKKLTSFTKKQKKSIKEIKEKVKKYNKEKKLQIQQRLKNLLNIKICYQ